jgi:hypothetical protein
MVELLGPLVYEYQEGGPRRLFASGGLAPFMEALGEDVLIQYCRCYIHADRLESLITMLHLTTKERGAKSTAALRVYLTFRAFTIGTLFEAVTSLNALRDALEAAGIFDYAEWSEGLQKWLTWSHRTPWLGKLRKKMAFHVDPDWIRDGLQAIAKERDPVTIIAADSEKARDSFMPLAHSAMIAGAGLAESDLLDAMDAKTELERARLKDKLNISFHGALTRRGLIPVGVKSDHVPSLPEEME